MITVKKKVGTFVLALLSMLGIGMGIVMTAGPAAAATTYCVNTNFSDGKIVYRACLDKTSGSSQLWNFNNVKMWNVNGTGSKTDNIHLGGSNTDVTLFVPPGSGGSYYGDALSNGETYVWQWNFTQQPTDVTAKFYGYSTADQRCHVAYINHGGGTAQTSYAGACI